MRITLNDGVRLFVDVTSAVVDATGNAPKERPTILLLHGGPGLDHMTFRPAFDALGRYAQVVYLDHRGCGRSDDGPTDRWHLDQWADDVAEAIEILGLQKPIVLGTSFGGFVAQRFASGYNDMIGGLVLMSTAYRPDIERTLGCLEAKGGKPAREAALRFFSDAGAAGVVDEYFKTCLALYTHGEIDLTVIGRVIQRPGVMMNFFRRGGEFFDIDLRTDLQNIKVPTLIVHGDEDPIFPLELAKTTLELLTLGRDKDPKRRLRSELVVIPNCGHLSEQDAPDRIVAEIVRFFAL